MAYKPTEKQVEVTKRYKKNSYLSKALKREFRKDAVRRGARSKISHTHGPALEQARDEIADYLARNPTPKMY